ncbi:SCP2 domain-containing protein [Shewanella colwelliana]|uniref:Ubiquinone biosynthesis accessory factor UbiJ n=1 Tax=Shewanella colwelliana TaxID=23 RepID=A0A1E5ISE9_SHECO|nr:SCP2 sterol-binding domain-containing protein [Shewanella colwelliana]MCZ4337274.1 SCP2 sterol-binding domain-containing protein [Shewanella colwelliana]OEG73347.1 sterol-binding protein [Shewanella colwelliana]
MKREIALLISAGLETALKQATNQSPDTYSKLHSLHGKVLCIQLTQLRWPLYLLFAKEIQVFSHYEGDVTTQVTADLTTLYKLTEGANLTELIKQDQLKLEGDLNLLQTFSHFMQQMEFDFAEPLSRYIGDAPTHILSQGAKQLKQDLLQVIFKSRDHLGQLTTEEYRLAPHKIEFIHFGDRIEQLAADTDALSQRIERLTSRANFSK